jgi:NAD(P)-dependent dehydrogenase (short-subunit alcohol dehydrogenase family)
MVHAAKIAQATPALFRAKRHAAKRSDDNSTTTETRNLPTRSAFDKFNFAGYKRGMAQYSDLNGKVVLVTGGANGIGAATVRAFHAQGALVFFCDKDVATGRSLALELPQSVFSEVDLMRENQIVRWIDKIARQQKQIHALINNAAFDPRMPLDQLTVKHWDNLFALNLRAYFITARQAAPHMPARDGAIVNLSSITFHIGVANMSAYVATKGGVIGFTRSLARELGAKGIRVNTVSPGWVMTDRQLRDYVRQDTRKLIKRSQCVSDLLQPRDLAEVILFMASNSSSAITGQEILADRGWSHV